MKLDIKKFYLKTPVKCYKYLCLKISTLPGKVIEEYQLKDKVDSNGYVYVEVRRGMYGFPHAVLIAQDPLKKWVEKHGYHQTKVTPGFWKHKLRPIAFSLVVNDFSIKYVGKEHANHLIAALKQDYEFDEDWDGTKYCGISLKWDYENREVHLSMTGYVGKGCEDSTTSKAKWMRINHINMLF